MKRWIGPALAGLASIIVTWYAWGSVNPIPVVSDEQSYVLQSRIFASFRWTVPSPPVPDAFEQSHVLVTPAVASKFPPGHALILTIGTLIGSPALASLLLSGFTGALLFLLVRRVANGSGWTAMIAVAIWLSDPMNLHFRPSYFSEVTTALLWLAAFWALLDWRTSRNRNWLFALAAAIGWGAITRPLTMLAFAVPIGVLVLRDVAREKRWRDFVVATLIGIVILGILPLWSAETTGSWRQSPLTLYQRQYLPFDHPGFGVDTTTPAKPLDPVNQATYAEFYREHRAHTPGNLPTIAWDRLRMIAISEWSSWRLVLLPFALIGLTAMTGELWFALGCSIALFVGYLSYGHFAEWTLYYFEGIPIISVITAVGMWRCAERSILAIARRAGHPANGEGGVPAIGVGRAPTLVVAIALALLVGWESGIARRNHQSDAKYYVDFNALLEALPKHPTIVFVRYAPRLQAHPNIVWNSPHLEDEPIWVVNDLGARDSLVMKVAGPRVPLYFDEDGRRIQLARDLLRSH